MLNHLMAALMSSSRSESTSYIRSDERQKCLSSDSCSVSTLHTKKAKSEAEGLRSIRIKEPPPHTRVLRTCTEYT